MRPRELADALLEASVVGSFTRLGNQSRRRLYDWAPLTSLRLDGRSAVVTGATSGLGRETALLLTRQGAAVTIVGRDEERTERSRAETGAAGSELADLSLMRDTRALARRIAETHETLDVLVLNAGAMTHAFTLTDEGNEVTLATHVLSQFLLVDELRPLLERSGARVIVTSSGGMYLERLDVDALQPTAADYDGVKAYALAKRAQVMLTHYWREKYAGTDRRFYAMHPGWTRTASVGRSMPRFVAILKSVLRKHHQGADTIVWLAATRPAHAIAGSIWFDRKERSSHIYAHTPNSTATPADVAATMESLVQSPAEPARKRA